jgi:hypothetical protein
MIQAFRRMIGEKVDAEPGRRVRVGSPRIRGTRAARRIKAGRMEIASGS